MTDFLNRGHSTALTCNPLPHLQTSSSRKNYLRLMNHKLIEEVTTDVKQTLTTQSAGHGWDHICRVHTNAIKIHLLEGGDRQTIELAALLHDVGDAKFNDGKELSGKISRELLRRHELDEALIDHIVHIVDNLSFRKQHTAEPLSLEGRIVQDADRLDALGAIGIVRTIEYGQYQSQPFFDPSKPESKSGVMHFHDKLFRLPALLNTNTAKEMANHQIQFMRGFLLQYFSEIQVAPPTWLTR